ncbi:hypothetical protein QFZ28_003044 [Neobacillus niacini]|nr:hypothetical protein [Neobacillus niacini]MDQ1002644.1 hypothetical protein [Neobacillus niacini]
MLAEKLLSNYENYLLTNASLEYRMVSYAVNFIYGWKTWHCGESVDVL